MLKLVDAVVFIGNSLIQVLMLPASASMRSSNASISRFVEVNFAQSC